MERYRVLRIDEQLYGCEELPEGQPVLCDVLLEDLSGQRRVLACPDAELTRLDIHGWIPSSIIETDPYYCSMVLSNLGSIRLKSGYHHLTNWGTCSLFCIIGEKALRPYFDEQGRASMRETLDLGLTIDERLADGYYYSKSVRLLQYLLEHPWELEKPMKEEVQYE